MTEKIQQTCSYLKDSLDKVRSKEWAEPVGRALKVTGKIVQGFGSFAPGFGILGGALILGSTVLNPMPKLSDLKRTEKSLKLEIAKLKSVSDSNPEVDSLSKDLEKVQNSITNFNENNSELIDNPAQIKLDVQDQFQAMSKEMKSLESDVKELKDIVTATFELIVDQRYKDGIEAIEAAYKTFLDGANDIEATIKSFDYYIVELQTNFNQNLNPEKIEEYLRIIKRHKGKEMCNQLFNYILVVKSKYLQIMTIYYINKQDFSRVACNFERFNKHYFELKESLDKVLKEKVNDTNNAKISNTEKSPANASEMEQGKRQRATTTQPKNENETGLVKLLKENKKKVALAIAVCILIAIIVASTTESKSDGKLNQYNSTVFLMVKTGKVGGIKIQMTKGLKVNKPKYKVAKATGKTQFCNSKKVDELLQGISDKRRTLKDISILFIDLGVSKCRNLLKKQKLQKANLAALVILDSTAFNYNSVMSSIQKIDSYAVISISKKDVKYLLKSLVKEGTTVDIWFDKLEDIFQDEDFYNIDCNLDKQCIHFYTPHPQQVYLGCGGVPKYRATPDITCYYNGRSCPDLVKLRTNFNNFSSCDEIEGLPYKKGSTMWPSPTCQNATVYRSLEQPLSCPGEDPFWMDTLHSNLSSVCYTAKKETSIIISKQTTKGTKLCDAKVRSCKTWGPWFDSGCSISNPLRNEMSQTRYRFCKHSAQCVLIEVEITVGVGACNNYVLVEGAEKKC